MNRMKNLLIYFNPQKQFGGEYEQLTKIQIDNSLSLDWNSKDLLLVTNFDYEYRGIKATVVGKGDYEVFDQNKSSKIPIINRLFKDGLIEDELYWFHDHDAFQLIPFEMTLNKDAGFTDHGYINTWNAGSFFFTKAARDIFEWIWEYMNLRGTNEQDALTYMWENNINNINQRWEMLNMTYNVGFTYHHHRLEKASKPIRVAHFHPRKKHHLDLFRDILPDRLMAIFNQYGIK